MEYRIRCPYHEADEVLDVPGNPETYEGSMDCAPPPGKTPGALEIRIIHGLLVDALPKKLRKT